MEIKTTQQIKVWDPIRAQCHGAEMLFRNKRWVSVEELIERIKTICNHGNERDMRFRNYLLRELKKGGVIENGQEKD